VDGVRKGLEDEGMADLAAQVKIAGGGNENVAQMRRKESICRRQAFSTLPTIFLPRVLHRDPEMTAGCRLLDYDRDILGLLPWETFSFRQADSFFIDLDEKRRRTIARVDIEKRKEESQAVFSLEEEALDGIPEEGLDKAFLVRQLMDVIPNPWQGMRILNAVLGALHERGVAEENLYAGRLDLLKAMKIDLREQAHQAAEALFREKIEKGEIILHLVASHLPGLNWVLAKTLEIEVGDNDRILRRKNGAGLEKSFFEKVYERDFNNLEKETAWYLDSSRCVYWWHRLAVNQDSYSLQGWQRHKVYPDLLACIHGVEGGKFRFTVLETKGEHLKGNDDTDYKQKLFELLTNYKAKSIRAGSLDLESEDAPLTFTMLMEDTWKDSLKKLDIY
jgi:type III restriction enzyme